MTETKKELLQSYLPEYEDIESTIDQFSDYEINLVRNNLPDDIGDLESSIKMEVQWEIITDLCSPFMDDWEDFFSKYEGEIMDICYNDCSFIHYNSYNNAYEISKDTIIDLCKDLIAEAEEEYTINEDVNFLEVIADLNKNFPIKFCAI